MDTPYRVERNVRTETNSTYGSSRYSKEWVITRTGREEPLCTCSNPSEAYHIVDLLNAEENGREDR